MLTFFYCRYGNEVSPVWQWLNTVQSHLVLLPFRKRHCLLHCFCIDTVSPEFSSLHLHPLAGFEELVAAALFLHGSGGKSCWRLDLPYCCHDSDLCLWESCNLLWDPCHQLPCNCFRFLQLVICMVRRNVLPYPDLSGALLCNCPSHQLSEAETWERNRHQKHQHCVRLASLHVENNYNPITKRFYRFDFFWPHFCSGLCLFL